MSSQPFVVTILRAILPGWLVFLSFLLPQYTSAQKDPTISFEVTMERPATHRYHVMVSYSSPHKEVIEFKMPAWTPGYYQLMNYASQVDNVSATDEAGNHLSWTKTGSHTWQVKIKKNQAVRFAYDIKATNHFVASNYLDEQEGYIAPAGMFMYVAGQLQQPAVVTLHPYAGWKPLVATGLDSMPGRANTFTAPNFDVLYDSPLLMGKLEQLPSFTVGGIPHSFVGYKLGTFDQHQFMIDLQKIIEAATDLIGDIPYKHYTFLAIGPGGGGIEHLNSASISFNGNDLNTDQGRLRLYLFLAHEYFHHYNVKRIRPQALGPFDYQTENRTNMLWVSEGFTVYYEYLILRRAGLMTDDQLLNALRSNLSAYENKPGHRFQSATQASYDTWSDGPFGRTGDDAYKTISYYQKGPILGMMLDFKIRHETRNKKSLDYVMRTLYHTYYQQKKRGFTDEEFQATCETVAGKPLTEVFAYASTVQEPDYPKYLGYAGLEIDTTLRSVSGTWLGLTLRQKADSLLISSVDWESPGWKAGIRSGAVLLKINGESATLPAFNALKAGESLTLFINQQGQSAERTLLPGTKWERSFQIHRVVAPDQLQNAIWQAWIKGK